MNSARVGVLASLAIAAAGDGASAAAAKTTTRPPVKVMVIVDQKLSQHVDQKYVIAGDRAAVKPINANGGLGGSGRPLEMVICNTNLDQDRANACARKAARDPKYVAVVGSLTIQTIDADLAKAGLAVLPSVPGAVADYYEPNVFNTNGGGLSSTVGQVEQAAAAGGKDIAILG